MMKQRKAIVRKAWAFLFIRLPPPRGWAEGATRRVDEAGVRAQQVHRPDDYLVSAGAEASADPVIREVKRSAAIEIVKTLAYDLLSKRAEKDDPVSDRNVLLRSLEPAGAPA